MNQKNRSFAVILSGCGSKDGAEIHESVCTLLAIDRVGAQYQCFAPDIDQYQVTDFLTDEQMNEKRNVLRESARIARGNIKPLDQFNAQDFDALIIPGGFGGAALNLSTFGIDGENMKVNLDVENAVRAMVAANKPIGALCIAPVILGKLLGDVKLTFGQDEKVGAVFQKMGATIEKTTHGEIVIDDKYKVVTTPCYMLDASIKNVADGAENLIKTIKEIIESNKS